MASSVAFAAYNLAIHPQVQKKLQAEIDKTFPGKVAQRFILSRYQLFAKLKAFKSPPPPLQCRPTYEKLGQTKYLDTVIMETWRLYPIANRIERVANSNVEINGVLIPKGMIVAEPIHTLQRDPEVWPDPDSFKPERYTASHDRRLPDFVSAVNDGVFFL